MPILSEGILQASTTIAKTTQTIMGSEINCRSYDTIVLFIEYTKGDETGVLIQAHYRFASGGTDFQDISWSAAAGTKLATVNEFKMTASVDRYIPLDVEGFEYVRFTQGGSDNDGTPDGTIAANYTMTGN